MKLFRAIVAAITALVLVAMPVSAMQIQISGADELRLDAAAALLLDLNTGIVMYNRNMHERNYPASMTKVMTALLTLEAFHDNLNARVPFSYEAVFSIPPGSSSIAMNDNETLSVLEALYAIMLPSANEVSNALAELVSGNMEDFATLMTARAIELGAVNTRFTNAHGLHDPNHFTTAYDMALIMREALRFPVFQEIISTTFREIPPTERQPLPRPMGNTNAMLTPASTFFHPYVIGGKTGFTNEARHTLVSYGRMRNMELITVVMGLERAGTFVETAALLDFGFENFENVLVFDRHSYTRDIPLLGTSQSIRAVGERTLTLSLPRGVRELMNPPHFDIPQYIDPSVSDGDQLGTATIHYGDIVLAEIPMFAETPTNFVPEVFVPPVLPEDFTPEPSILGWLVTALQVVFVVAASLAALLLVIISKNKRRRKRRYLTSKARRSSRSHHYRYRYKN